MLLLLLLLKVQLSEGKIYNDHLAAPMGQLNIWYHYLFRIFLKNIAGDCWAGGGGATDAAAVASHTVLCCIVG